MTTRSAVRSASLGDLPLKISGGTSVLCLDRPARGGEKGVLKLSALAEGELAPEENKAVPRSLESRLGRSLTADTVLISRSNTAELVGSVAYVSRTDHSLYLPDLMWSIEATEQAAISMRWLALVLSAPSSREALSRIASGTSGSMKKISMRNFRAIEIRCPAYDQQEAIASFVGRLQSKISLYRSLESAKRKLKQEIVSQLLSQQLRLEAFAGEWQTVRLGEVFAERVELGRTDLPLLSITANRGLVYRDQLDRKDTSNADKSAYLRIAKGDVGYNTMRMWQGVSAHSSLEGIVSPAYTVCIPSPQVDGAFAAHYFKYPPVVNLFRRYSQGLVDDTLNLKFNHFSKIKLNLPAVAEQRAIAGLLSRMDTETELLTSLVHALSRQKRAVLDKLLSGDVAIAVP